MDAAFDVWLERLERDGYLDVGLILTELFVHRDTEGRTCRCSCHPSLGSPAQHGDIGCPCTRTPAEDAASLDQMFAELDAERARWEATDEGRASLAKEAAERAELESWIEADDGIEVSEWGGWFPEQWRGTVDGHSFSFREKRGHWSIEIDLAETGETYLRAVFDEDAADGDDLFTTVPQPVVRGQVIAEGWESDLGVTPLHHGRFIANTIRAHLRREGCAHPGARRYCPECGAAVG